MIKQIQDAYIVAASRTPIGKSGRGYFKNTRSDDLLVRAVQSALAQVPSLDPKAIEDAIIFARTLAMHASSSNTPASIPALFSTYESIRRPRIDAAYDEAVFRWETVKDSGWLVHKLKTWMTPWFIWWTAKTRAKGFEEDLGTIEIKVAESNGP